MAAIGLSRHFAATPLIDRFQNEADIRQAALTELDYARAL